MTPPEGSTPLPEGRMVLPRGRMILPECRTTRPEGNATLSASATCEDVNRIRDSSAGHGFVGVPASAGQKRCARVSVQASSAESLCGKSSELREYPPHSSPLPWGVGAERAAARLRRRAFSSWRGSAIVSLSHGERAGVEGGRFPVRSGAVVCDALTIQTRCRTRSQALSPPALHARRTPVPSPAASPESPPCSGPCRKVARRWMTARFDGMGDGEDGRVIRARVKVERRFVAAALAFTAGLLLARPRIQRRGGGDASARRRERIPPARRRRA